MDARNTHKHTRYDGPCRAVDDKDFTALIMNTRGGIHKEAVHALKRMQRCARRSHHNVSQNAIASRNDFVHTAIRRLSFAVRRDVADRILSATARAAPLDSTTAALSAANDGSWSVLHTMDLIASRRVVRTQA